MVESVVFVIGFSIFYKMKKLKFSNIPHFYVKSSSYNEKQSKYLVAMIYQNEQSY